MKKTNKKTKNKIIKRLAAGVVVPAHAQMPNFKVKKEKWPPKFTHISMVGFDNVPKDQIDEMGYPKPGHTGNHGFILLWAAEDIGFGEYTFVQHNDGTIECDTECSGKKFTEALMVEWLKRIKFKP